MTFSLAGRESRRFARACDLAVAKNSFVSVQIAFRRESADCFLENRALSNRGDQLFPQLAPVPLAKLRAEDYIELAEFARDSRKMRALTRSSLAPRASQSTRSAARSLKS